MIDLSHIDTWIPFREYYSLVYGRLQNNSRAFEIGVYKGASTLYFADLIRCGKKSIEFHCCDLFSLDGDYQKTKKYDLNYWESFYKDVSRFGLKNYINIHKGNSLNILSTFPDKYFDFIYIDGDHRCEPVFADVLMSLKKLRSGGILAGHDESWKSVRCGLRKANLCWNKFPGNVWEALTKKTFI